MRRRYLKGKYEDSNKYFLCPKCGAHLRVDRNLPRDRMHNTIGEIHQELYPFDTHSNVLVLDKLEWIGNVIINTNRTPETYVSRKVKSTTGCWFCGNVNF